MTALLRGVMNACFFSSFNKCFLYPKGPSESLAPLRCSRLQPLRLEISAGTGAAPGPRGEGREQGPVKPVWAGGAEAHCDECAGGAGRRRRRRGGGGEELRKQQRAGGCGGPRAAGAALGGGREIAGPSEKSGDEEHVSAPGGSAGNHPKREWWSHRSHPGQLWTPESSAGVAGGSVARMRSRNAPYSHALRVPDRSASARTRRDGWGHFTLLLPGGVGSI